VQQGKKQAQGTKDQKKKDAAAAALAKHLKEQEKAKSKISGSCKLAGTFPIQKRKQVI
jgi:hypothetical protein